MTRLVAEKLRINYFNLLGHLKIMSLSTARLNQLMKECYQRNDVGGALVAFKSFQASHCYNPIKMRIYDAHTQTYVKRWLPCGRCYHCLETKINSWVTRMYAHLEDFKHVYFITLTYRSFTSLEGVNRLLIEKLNGAIWFPDSNNYHRHYSYNPCLLCKSHYQKFFKRLRKNTGYNDITYVLCGEYGKTYGRPHFHIVLFSNNEISLSDIIKAWSVSLWCSDAGEWSYRTNQRKNGAAYDFPIGRVDFNDLVSNGTLNTTARVRVDGTYLNASNCFAYVCKYVCKQDSANFSRVDLAYNNLFTDVLFCNDPELGATPFHVAAARAESLGLYTLLYQLKQNSYYEKIPFPSALIADKLLYNSSKKICGSSVNVENFASTHQDFRTQFAPFVEFSRGTPIGSIYASTHLPEFTQGVYNKPLLQDRGFVVPSYFRRKASDHVYGLRKMRTTFRGRSFVKTGLPDLYRRFESADLEECPLYECVPSWKSNQDYAQLLQQDSHVFKDLATSERIILCAGRAMSFKYDRSTRKYIRTSQIPVADWIRAQMSKLVQDFRNYRSYSADYTQSLKEQEEAFYYLARTTNRKKRDLSREYEDQQNEYLSRKNKEYQQLKLDFA